jgi:hypothetical protein
MRVPPSKLQALRTRQQVARADIDALAKQAGADPAARAQLALDVLSLGSRLDPEAAAFAQSLVAEQPTPTKVERADQIAAAFAEDAAQLSSPAAVTMLLSAHVEQLAKMVAEPGVRDQVAGDLLAAASTTQAAGDPGRPEGDAWSAQEWPGNAQGWADMAPWGRLVAILDARGLRPASVPRESAQSGWWSELTAPSALFRGDAPDAVQVGGSTIDKAQLEASLVALGSKWSAEPLFDADQVKAVLDG